MSKVIDLTGKVFESLTVIKRIGSHKSYALWLCLCKCGNYKKMTSHKLITKNSKSCGCTRYAKLSALNKTKRKPEGEACLNHLFSGYKRSAKIRGYTFDLNKEQVRTYSKSNCFYCDSLPCSTRKLEGTHGVYVYNGIDRVDNTKGYSVDNCIPCCKKCNIAKSTMGEKEFYTWISQAHAKLQAMGLLS